MAAEIITIASLKGGAGKTATAYALAVAAAASGLRTVVLDLDSAGGLTTALTVGRRPVTVADVILHGRPLESALLRHRTGLQLAPADRALADAAISEHRLQSLVEPLRDSSDIVLIDTDPAGSGLLNSIAVADRVVIPTTFDILSLRAAALTIGLAESVQGLGKVGGLSVGNVTRVMTRTEESLFRGLTSSGLAYETVLWTSPDWANIVAGTCDHVPDDVVMQGKLLLREVAVRAPSDGALRYFISLAKGNREAVAAG